MNRHQDIDKRVSEALESLDGIQRAEASPWFLTRVKARLEREESNVWEKTGRFLSRPVVAFAGLVLILGLNAFILLEKVPESTTSGPISFQNGQLAEEENMLTAANSFDYENLEP
ncbi:MAG: hypothetical protein H7Y42_06250 [Chitinophagaceae bacterium]|nr:hypothetical protein [Chitinophagaceae bacterium]